MCRNPTLKLQIKKKLKITSELTLHLWLCLDDVSEVIHFCGPVIVDTLLLLLPRHQYVKNHRPMFDVP